MNIKQSFLSSNEQTFTNSHDIFNGSSLKREDGT